MPVTGTQSKRQGKARNDSELENEQVQDSSGPEQVSDTPKQKKTASKETTGAASCNPTQTKIDTMFKPTETGVTDLTEILQNLQNRLDKVASQDYIEKTLGKLITEEIFTKKLEEIKADINAKNTKRNKNCIHSVRKSTRNYEQP